MRTMLCFVRCVRRCDDEYESISRMLTFVGFEYFVWQGVGAGRCACASWTECSDCTIVLRCYTHPNNSNPFAADCALPFSLGLSLFLPGRGSQWLMRNDIVMAMFRYNACSSCFIWTRPLFLCPRKSNNPNTILPVHFSCEKKTHTKKNDNPEDACQIGVGIKNKTSCTCLYSLKIWCKPKNVSYFGGDHEERRHQLSLRAGSLSRSTIAFCSAQALDAL